PLPCGQLLLRTGVAEQWAASDTKVSGRKILIRPDQRQRILKDGEVAPEVRLSVNADTTAPYLRVARRYERPVQPLACLPEGQPPPAYTRRPLSSGLESHWFPSAVFAGPCEPRQTPQLNYRGRRQR